MQSDGTKRDLENAIPIGAQLKRVTARGRKYVYVRGSNIAIVKGFVGSNEDLEALIARNLWAPLRPQPKKRRNLPASLISGWREDAARGMHKTTKNRAMTKGRTYSLSVPIISQMLAASKDRCQVTGLSFDYGPTANPDWRTNPLGPSLDRISNKGGYDPDNVRLVCTSVNYAINEFGLAHFEKICRAYVERNPA